MKIGVITWWRNNYGSILQAYALQNVLNKMPDVECEIISQYDRNPATLKNFINKLRTRGIINTLKISFWKFSLPKMRERTSALLSFVNDNLRISDNNYTEDTIYKTNELYDVFICGSDQIWNPTLTRLDSIYWLTFVENNKSKIAYAPSVGVKTFTDKQKNIVRKNLSSFKAVSCRELSGTRLINATLYGNRCEKVVDPTLLVDKSVWDDISERKVSCEKYIFVYFLRCNKKHRKMVEEFATQKGLKVYSMPFLEPEFAEIYDFSFGNKKIWKASPADFISYIRNAEYVFTDSFHASVFSIIYHRNFFVFPKKGKAQMERLMSLFNESGVGNRIIDSTKRVDDISEINWENVDLLLNNSREDSYNYLKEAINKCRGV